MPARCSSCAEQQARRAGADDGDLGAHERLLLVSVESGRRRRELTLEPVERPVARQHLATLALGSRPSRIAAKNSRSCSSMPFIDTSTFDTSIFSSLPLNRSS